MKPSPKSQTNLVTALDLPPATPLADDVAAYLDKCRDKLGLIPNVLTAYTFDAEKFRAFTRFYNEIMLAESGLDKLDREMIAVVISSVNRCLYCVTAHGAAVRALADDPELGDQLAINYRTAILDPRRRAMLDFAVLVTESPEDIDEDDRDSLREAGFSDRDIWDIAAVAAFFNMSNRLASAVDMRPNRDYYYQSRTDQQA